LSNPDGPEATETKPPNSHQHPATKRSISRGVKAHNDRHDHRSKKAQRTKKLRALNAIRDKAVKSGLVEHGLAPIQVLQRLIDDSFIDYMVERHNRDQAEADGKKFSDQKLRSLRKEAAYFASIALQYNIGDRMAKVQEARTALLAQLLQQTLRHPDINLPEAKIRKIPGILEQTATQLQGEISPPPDKNNLERIPPHRLAS